MAINYSNLVRMDKEIGAIINELKKQGLNTKLPEGSEELALENLRSAILLTYKDHILIVQ